MVDAKWVGCPYLHHSTPYTCLSRSGTCLLYTSDAADDLLCVDLGGRRIIKKKKKNFIYFFFFFFFFKQKTAYEIMPSLVGSEMCIRDSPLSPPLDPLHLSFSFWD